MPEPDKNPEIQEMVDFLVKKSTSRVMLKEAIEQVKEVEQQERLEKKVRNFLLPMLLTIATIIFLLLFFER